jgi:hypothetical protein
MKLNSNAIASPEQIKSQDAEDFMKMGSDLGLVYCFFENNNKTKRNSS